MKTKEKKLLDLTDAQQRQLGQVKVESCADDLILGIFTPGCDFSAIESLFRRFEEAVNLQALHEVDKLDAAIAELGLQLSSPDDGRQPIHDVQIWSDGGISCKLRLGDAAVNGNPGSSQAAQPATQD